MKVQLKYNILVVDDEKNARAFLKKLIKRYFEKITAEIYLAENISEATQVIFNHNINIVFLDIKLGNENGFDLLQKFVTRNFEVVFTTAHKEYAIKAIKESVFDYLLKPINHIDLMEVFHKIKQKKTQEQLTKSIQELGNKLNPFINEFNKIALPTNERMELYALSDICSIQASGSYVEIQLSDGSRVVASKSIRYFEEKLPSKVFFRCHKSYMVNLNHIENFNPQEKLIILTTGEEIPVSARKKEAFINEISRI